MSWPHTVPTRYLQYLFVSLLIGWLGAGCATIGTRTAGETATMRWEAVNFQNYKVYLDERELYKYTLVLEDKLGSTITFTKLSAELQNNPHSYLFYWDKMGQWVLPAQGKLKIQLGTYRHCIAVNCIDRGPLAPMGKLILSGTNAQGQPITEVIRVNLPFVDNTAQAY